MEPESHEPQLVGEQVKQYDREKLRKEILKRPPVKGERVKGVEYRCLTTAQEGLWGVYLKQSRELGQDYAKMYLETQGWDVDWDYDYEVEIEARLKIGRKLTTEHRVPETKRHTPDYKQRAGQDGEDLFHGQAKTSRD